MEPGSRSDQCGCSSRRCGGGEEAALVLEEVRGLHEAEMRRSRVGTWDAEFAGQAVLLRALRDTRVEEVARHVLDARRDQCRGLGRQHVSSSGGLPLACGVESRLTRPPRSGRTLSDPRLEVDLPEAGESEALEDALDALRTEIEQLRASRRRLVRAADVDRRRIERELHGGVQQHLVAVAMRLQLLESALGSDPAAVKALLEEIGRDVQDAVDEAARLAQRIHVPFPDLGLAAALRAAATSAGVPASVDVSAGSSCSPEILHTVYACWLEALEQPGDSPAITVREDAGALVFDVVPGAGPSAGLDALRDRVEALGGTLTIRAETGGGVRIAGSLPLSR